MRINKLLKLHKRATAILEMIRDARMRRIDWERYHNRAFRAGEYHSHATREHQKRNMAKYRAIGERLERYYADVMQRLTENIFDNMHVPLYMIAEMSEEQLESLKENNLSMFINPS